MRFKLHLTPTNRNENCLPIDYQYMQSAVIYHILGSSDEEYASWLHDNGYQLNNGKRFKLFCFSRFVFSSYKVNTKLRTINFTGNNNVEWNISFLPERSTQEFVLGLFKGAEFMIGNHFNKESFQVSSLENISPPLFSDVMEYDALSPVCVKQHIQGRVQYLSPTDVHYADGILEGLLSKYEALHGHKFEGSTSDFRFDLLQGNVKPSLVNIKGIKVRGYSYKFRLTAPPELQQIAYDGGIGEECSQGFGFIDRIEE